MPLYIMLSTLTDDGMETLHEHPRRIKEVNEEVEKMGAKVLQQWAVLGPYDFVNLVEAPDNETIARVSVALGARGTVKLMTLPAIPIDEFIAGLEAGVEEDEDDESEGE
ncbi:GYD domain-containing protein [Thermomicrobiaceae bacterium CFH 74404]|uniref:GYD domain-containing protein n=1 Tax=Thermalbibacter longus TaxID=2951981 RepID=A0AA41WGG4_9BACT|nr:GYD domain-containing protein [Thermalbibacter longus]MCM8749600.1 GYD domain-containing protein [Thermalbibacter longus]